MEEYGKLCFSCGKKIPKDFLWVTFSIAEQYGDPLMASYRQVLVCRRCASHLLGNEGIVGKATAERILAGLFPKRKLRWNPSEREGEIL